MVIGNMNTPKIESSSVENFESVMESVISRVVHGYPRNNELGKGFASELENLRKELRSIERGEVSNQNQLKIQFDEYNKEINIPTPEGRKGEVVKIGEVAAGMEWGSEYFLDPVTFKKKPAGQKIYNQYMAIVTEQKSIELLNKYIFEKEIKINEKGNSSKHKAYTNLRKTESKTSIRNLSLGAFAEKVVKSILKRISLDNPHLSFEILQANAYQDVDLKIDFIIKVNKKNRGVQVGAVPEGMNHETAQEKDVIRKVQFTINDSEASKEMKQRQLEKFSDVVLVKIPQNDVLKAQIDWRKERNPRHTPETFLAEKIKIYIIREALKGLVDEQELENWIKKQKVL